MEIRIKLDNFEGPLDLLLHLIEKKELDINQISISQVIDEYLQCIKEIQTNLLGIKIEFLQIAAELLEIKALSLLGVEEKEKKEEYLQNRIIEYKKYKKLAEILREYEDEYNISYTKSGEEINLIQINEIDLTNLSTDLLFNIFINIKKQAPVDVKKISLETSFTIANGVTLLQNILENNHNITFYDIFKTITNKTEKIAIFLAILELYKMSQISICDENLAIKKLDRVN